MAVEKISISLPSDLAKRLDRYAQRWNDTRSHAIVRIFQEWEDYERRRLQAAPDGNHPLSPVLPVAVPSPEPVGD